jgi:nitrite reductase/ring-hydroxylating ferredoxin subunit
MMSIQQSSSPNVVIGVGKLLMLLFISSQSDSTYGWSILSTTKTTSISSVRTFQLKRCTLEMKRGRGSIGSEVADGNNGLSSSNSGIGKGGRGLGQQQSNKGPVINWIPIAASVKELPSEPNTVGIIDTNLPTMKVSNTNPTGAVSVLKYEDETYCFAVNCPSCQIPLTKAKAFEPSLANDGITMTGPRLVCDLCKATYDLKTGSKQNSAAENPGFLGSIVKTVFAANNNAGDLKTYKLGERNGKLLIAID